MGFLNHLTLFNVEFSDKINLLTNLVFLIVIILNHYILIPRILNSFRDKKWEVGIFFSLLLYACSTLIAHFPLYYIAETFPKARYFRKSYEYYGIKSWDDVISYKPLLWTFTCVFFWNFVSMLVQTAINLYRAQKEKLSIQQERNNMELNFLRMQIQPHFLFNTLNNIYGMALENERVANSIIKLSELLRFSLSESKKEWITLEEEILFLKNYIDLERIRHRPEKLQLNCNFSASNADQRNIKPLLLVNFIENAFKHGVNKSVGTSWVDIQLTTDDNGIYFYIANSQPLPIDNNPQYTTFHDVAKKTEYSNIGLENVRRRLELEYFGKHELSIEKTDERYTVQLKLLF